MAVNGGEESLVFDRRLSYNMWVLFEDGLYFVDHDKRNIIFFKFSTNEIKKIVTSDQRIDGYFAVSPDRSWLLFTHHEQGEADIVMVENFR
jgi:Tol biopolymer transport system component